MAAKAVAAGHSSEDPERIPHYPDSYPDLNPVDIYRSIITGVLVGLSGVPAETVYPALQWQNNLSHGDLVLAVPRLRLKGPKKPAELAQEWAEKFPRIALLSPPEVDGLYLRFRFAPEKLPGLLLPMIFKQGKEFGLNKKKGLKNEDQPEEGRKKVIVEFSSPNIAKEFHAGHLRSTIIGGFISNLYEGFGWDVVRMNYLGDWGRQYGLLAVGWKKFHDDEEFKKNPTGHLFDIYVKISALFKPEDEAFKEATKRGEDTSTLENQGLLGEVKRYFKQMEDGDEETLALWKYFRDLSIEKYKATYARLNIHFDKYDGESQVKKESMETAERILSEKGITEIDKGAKIIDFGKHGAKKLATAIVRNRNGTTNYLLRDVGSVIERWETYKYDKSIYVVMAEQDMHVARNFKVVSFLGPPYDEASRRCLHVSFGKVAGMSTRKGTVKFLDEILEEVGSAMHEVMRKNADKYAQVEDPDATADVLGISAVMVQDMGGKRVNGYPFDIARMTSFEGDTGPYLQYAHARVCSIARKAKLSEKDVREADFSLLKEPHAADLLRLMAQWPDMVIHTMTTLEPTTILTYLFRMTHQLSSSYDVLRVVGAPEGEATGKARAALYEAARQVLSNGMRLLGLTPVERM